MQKTFLIILLSALGQYAIGQSNYGLKAGANFSEQNRSHFLKTKPLAGYQVGAFYKYDMKSRWSLSAEVNYSLIGTKAGYFTEEQIRNMEKTPYYDDKMGYIEIPITLQYNINKLYFGAGPSVAFNLFSKVSNLENASLRGPYYRKIDAGANVLAGYKISKKLDINLRYSHGLVNILDGNTGVKISNRFVNLSMLYSLKWK